MISLLVLMIAGRPRRVPENWINLSRRPIAVSQSEFFCVSNDGKKLYSNRGDVYTIATGSKYSINVYSRTTDLGQRDLVQDASLPPPVDHEGTIENHEWTNVGGPTVFYAFGTLLGVMSSMSATAGCSNPTFFCRVGGKPVSMDQNIGFNGGAFPDGKPSYRAPNSREHKSDCWLNVFYRNRSIHIKLPRKYGRFAPIFNSVLPGSHIAYGLAAGKSWYGQLVGITIPSGRVQVLPPTEANMQYPLDYKMFRLCDETIWSSYRQTLHVQGDLSNSFQTESLEVCLKPKRYRQWHSLIVQGCSANGEYVVYGFNDLPEGSSIGDYATEANRQVWVARVGKR